MVIGVPGKYVSKYVSRYWEMVLRNREGLEGDAEGVRRLEESRVFHQYLLSSLGEGAESEERPQLVVWGRAVMSLGIRFGEGEGKVCSLPSCFPGWSVCGLPGNARWV